MECVPMVKIRRMIMRTPSMIDETFDVLTLRKNKMARTSCSM